MLCNIHNIHVLRYCRHARNDFIYKSCAISIQLQVLFFSIDLDKLYFFLNSTKLIKIALSLLNTKGERGGLDSPAPAPPPIFPIFVHVLSFDKMNHKDISNGVYMCNNAHVLQYGKNTSHQYHKLQLKY